MNVSRKVGRKLPFIAVPGDHHCKPLQLAVLAGLLEGKGVSTVEETSNVLGIYAVITGETAPDEGLILACWAGMLRDAAQEKAEKDGEPGKWD
ncbi:hypothetical protein PX554_26335 [Sphingomonas sp. H39-1-10]|uniref:hypothetical protein n=1 Tax=Sphingomonas pollutisoli TaxID=3030829 RepID=UPI0023B99FE4|nr:hypothetical protein [Sphingomonas pollutisoli]MDF0491632.1 hypothetical protein [Sphingomonas pollutisoli]